VNPSKLNTLLILLLSTQVFAQEQDNPFDVFMDELTPSYDIKVESFEYDKENEVNGRRGSFSFTNFNVVNSSISTQLNNENGVYDADIYMINRRIGFINDNFKFAYKLRDTDFEFIDSIKYGNLLSTHFVMNRDEIFMNSEAIEFREPRTYIKALNYELNCGRHPDYQLNDGQGLISGCMNYGTLKPVGQPGVDFKLKFFSESEEELVNVNSYLTSLETTQETIAASGISISGSFGGTTEIEVGQYSLECAKDSDLIKISGNTLINPCMKDLSFNTPRLQLSLLEDGAALEAKELSVQIENEVAQINLSSFGYSSPESVFNIGELELKCDVLREGELSDFKTYIASCLTETDLDAREAVSFGFHQTGISEKTGEPLNIKIDGAISDLKIKENRLILSADRLGLNVSEEVFFEISGLGVNCQKDPELKTLEIPLLLDHCKKDANVETSNVDFHIINEKAESVRGQIDTRFVYTKNGVLNFHLDHIKMVDKESRKLIQGLLGNCKMKADTDLFDVESIIDACTTQMAVNIRNLFTDERATRQDTLKRNDFNINHYRIDEDKAGVSDVRASITDRKLAASVRVRVLGMNLLVTIQGLVNWNKDTSVLTLDVTHSRLPLGITSKGMFMSIAKKFLASDMIKFGSGNKIHIQL
tara:strand:+ start:1445 stop:3388 length:1944 start_codon:yes stop_codon:yes gene_type:complete